jgi:hypothetical protein
LDFYYPAHDLQVPTGYTYSERLSSFYTQAEHRDVAALFGFCDCKPRKNNIRKEVWMDSEKCSVHRATAHRCWEKLVGRTTVKKQWLPGVIKASVMLDQANKYDMTVFFEKEYDYQNLTLIHVNSDPKKNIHKMRITFNTHYVYIGA